MTIRVVWPRLLRAARVVVLVAAVASLFAGALVVGAVTHIDLRAGRATVRQVANRIFASQFAGTVRLGSLQRLDTETLTVSELTVATPAGEQVLHARGVRIEGGWLRGVVGGLIAGRGAIDPGSVIIEDAVLLLTPDATGKPTIRHAFAPRVRPPVPKTIEVPAKPRHALWLRDVRLEHVEVKSTLGRPVHGHVLDLSGSLFIWGDELRVDVHRTQLRETELVGEPIEGYAALALRRRGLHVRLYGQLDGKVAGIATTVNGGVDDGRFALRAAIPHLSATQLRPWVRDAPLDKPLSLSLTVSGKNGKLDLSGHAETRAGEKSSGRAEVRGRVVLGEVVRAHAVIDARALDGAVMGQTTSRINGAVALRLEMQRGQPAVVAAVRLDPSSAAGQPVPAATGTMQLGSNGARVAFRVDEPGIPADATVTVHDGEARFALRTGTVALSAAPRIADAVARTGQRATGHGRMRAEGRADIRGPAAAREIDVAARGQFDGVATSGVRFAHARFKGRLTGPRSALTLRADASMKQVALGQQVFTHASCSVAGPLSTPRVRATALEPNGRQLEASARVRALARGGVVMLDQIALSLVKGGTRINGVAERLRVAPGVAELRGLTVHGLGDEVNANVALVNGELNGTIQAERVELKPVSKLLGMTYPLRGEVAVDASLSGRGKQRRGWLDLTLRDGGMLVVDGVELDLATRIEGDQIRPDLTLRLANPPDEADPCGGAYATLAIGGEGVAVAGPLPSKRTWQRAHSDLTVEAKELRLRCLTELWGFIRPGDDLPEQLTGVLDARARVVRSPEQSWPSLHDVLVRTNDLVVKLEAGTRPFGSSTPLAASVQSDRLDAQFSGSLTHDGGLDGAVVLSARSPPRNGRVMRPVPLLQAEVATKLDLDRLLASDSSEARHRALADWLQHVTLSLSVRAPVVPLAAWRAIPEPWRRKLDGVEGAVGGSVFFEGTLHDPVIAARLQTRELRLNSDTGPISLVHTGALGSASGAPLTVDALANYQRGMAHLHTTLRSGDSAQLELEADAAGTLDLTEPLRPTAWDTDVSLRLDELPLAAIPALAERGIVGTLNGQLDLRGLGRKPELSAQFELIDVGTDVHRSIETWTMSLAPAAGVDPNTLVLQSHLHARHGGELSLTGYGSLAWKDNLIPRADEQAPAALLVEARALSLEAFEPFVAPAITRLGGTLDGSARFSFRELPNQDLDLDADFRLRRGVAYSALLGQPLHGIEAHLSGNERILRADPIVARAGAGRVHGWAAARHHNLSFEDLTGSFTVEPSEALALSLEGVPLGKVSGTIVVSATARPAITSSASGERRAGLDVALTGADIHVELPPGSSKQLQPLQTHPDIELSRPLERPEPSDPTDRRAANSLTTRLVGVHIAGRGLEIRFGTDPNDPIFLTDAGDASGALIIEGGHLNLLGKLFEIDSGIVRLRAEEPSNPYVNMSAHWAAPNGSTVYVDYVGDLRPISRDKFVFHSTPPRSPEAILSLLVLGDDRAADDDGELAGGQRATNLAGGLAAVQLNSLIGDVAPGISATVGTTDEGYVTTSVLYQLSDRVTAQATHERAAEGREATTSTTNSDFSARTTLSVDWRFAPSWLVRGFFGVGDDANRGIDLLFQHRY